MTIWMMYVGPTASCVPEGMRLFTFPSVEKVFSRSSTAVDGTAFGDAEP
ncbi:hypothetical protein [Streptomyces sp. NPDC085665]